MIKAEGLDEKSDPYHTHMSIHSELTTEFGVQLAETWRGGDTLYLKFGDELDESQLEKVDEVLEKHGLTRINS